MNSVHTPVQFTECTTMLHVILELTQDIASKGLALVYEKCGEEQKKDLVSILVDTLTTGKR